MVKRNLDAYLLAIRMDPKRRYLVVEGSRDKNFLTWLCDGEMEVNTEVLPVDTIDFPSLEGGNRGRLIEIAKAAYGRTESMRFFVDSDYDRYFSKDLPLNVIATDNRDLEGYVVSEKSFEKFLSLSLNKNGRNARAFMNRVLNICITIASIRIESEKSSLKLPFQYTQIKKYISRNTMGIDKIKYITALLQNAGISLKKRDEVITNAEQIEKSLSQLELLQYCHGKDIISVTERLLNLDGVETVEAEQLI